MKKKSALIFMILCLVIAGCSIFLLLDDEASSPGTEQEQTTAPKEVVDENLLTVDITLPASFFSPESPATDQLTPEQIEQGYKKAVVNPDGSVTYTINKAKWRKLLAEMKQSASASIDGFASSGDYPSVTSIKYNNDFSKVDVYVNRTAYESSMDSMVCLNIYMNAHFYQLFNGTKQENISCEIQIIDSTTNELINTVKYPDALQ